MKRVAISFSVMVMVLVTGWSQAAQAEERKGEVWIKLTPKRMGSDYAKPYVDGQEWEDHDYEQEGFKLVIRIQDIDKTWTFELRPSDSTLSPVTITTDPKRFKLKRIRGRTGRYVMTHTIKFKKAEQPKPKK